MNLGNPSVCLSGRAIAKCFNSKMISIHSKILEMFKNLKSDAMPKPPRPNRPTEANQNPEDNEEYASPPNEPEEIIVESADEDDETDRLEDEKMPKFKKSFFKPNKEDKPGKREKTGSSNVNTQATGNVINIINSKNVRWGNDYYMGPTNMKPPGSNHTDEKEEHIEKTNLIKLLIEAKIKPEHVFIDYISKNLGKNWHSFFRVLGFSKGAIETKEIDTASYGVSEARYKLLLDWMNDDSDGSRTLGRLADLLWKEGERELVKELALLYKNACGKKI